MIALEGVTVRLGGNVVLQGVDLEVAAGRRMVLLGPSGSGKSTILRLAVGLCAASAGRVAVLGETMTPRSAPELRRRLGYVIQDGGLFPHLTARANVTLMARHLGWDRAKIDTRVAELADLVRLPAAMIARSPLELSGGQRQRVALMRALMLDPDLLLLDEPLGALDPLIRAELQRDLRAIFRRLGKTVLLVTHDLAEAGYLGDEIALLNEGQIIQRGTVAALETSPASPFVTEFVSAQRLLHEGTAA